jgi:flagellar hook-length control protein FliK
VVARVPQIGVNAIGVKALSGKASVSESAPTGKFSEALAEATQQTNDSPSNQSTAVKPRVADGSYSRGSASAGKGKTDAKTPERNEENATHSEAPKNFNEQSATGLANLALPVPQTVLACMVGDSDSNSGSAVATENASGAVQSDSGFMSPFAAELGSADSKLQALASPASGLAGASSIESTKKSDVAASSTDASLEDGELANTLQAETTAQLQSATKNAAPLTSIKSGAASTFSLPQAKAGVDKAAKKSDSALSATIDSQKNIIPGIDQKPVANAGKTPSHAGVHSSFANGDSVQNLGASSFALSGVTPALPASTLSVTSSPQLEGSKESPSGSPAVDKAAFTPTEATSPVTAKGIEPAGSTKLQANSASSQDTTSTSGAAVDVPPAGATVAKPMDASAFNAAMGAQISSVAVNHKNDNATAKSDGHSAEVATQSPNGATQAEGHSEAAAAYPTSLFQTAKLVERMGQTELRLGIQAGEFGNVDIRTSMVRNQFTAEISVERGELSKALAAELPGLQSRLSEQRVPTANIILQNQTNTGSSSSYEQGSRQRPAAQQVAAFQGSEGGPVPASVAVPDVSSPTSRLDIHM